MSRFLSTKVLLFALVLLVVTFETSGCGRRRRRYHRRYDYTTTTPRYYNKRSIQESDQNDQLVEDSSEEIPEFSCGHTKKYVGPTRLYPPRIPASFIKQKKEKQNANRSQRIENSLPILKTSCGKILCTDSSNYPTAEMAKVVDEARERLKAGLSSLVFKNRGMDLRSFDSKIHGTTRSFLDRGVARCGINKNLTYPLEGYNRRHNQFFYVVNIPGFQQGVCTNECQCNSDKSANKSQYQAYTEEKLVVLPINQRQFRFQDLKIRKILVPHDCPRNVV